MFSSKFSSDFFGRWNIRHRMIASCWAAVLLLLSPLLTAWPVETAQYTLPQIAKKTMGIYFGAGDLGRRPDESYADWAGQFYVSQRYRKQAGVFVTLSAAGKTRACWGTLLPTQPNLLKETVFATLDALSKDYRYAPVRKAEWSSLKVQVSVVEKLEPITSYRLLNPLRDGLLVRSGSKAGVILSGEAIDAHHQWVMARTKAGIAENQPQQLYRLRVWIESTR